VCSKTFTYKHVLKKHLLSSCKQHP
jgi:hypothetical protein